MNEKWKYGPVTIYGKYVSMKNGRRITKYGLIKKQAALDWENSIMIQIRRPKEPFLGNVKLVADFYYHNKRSDLDENLLKDMIQIKRNNKPSLGIIKDDNQIKRHETNWFYDKDNPRVIFSLEEL